MLRALATAALLLTCVAAAAAQSIARDPAQVRAFRSEQPCPATGERRGACPGYQVDHIRPLCAGGEDNPANMQWIRADDHRFKTHVDLRECAKLKKMAVTPAAVPASATAPGVRYVDCVTVNEDWSLSDKPSLEAMPRMDDHRKAHIPPRPLPPPAPPPPPPSPKGNKLELKCRPTAP